MDTLFNRAKKRIPGGVNSPVRAFRSVGGEPFITERAEGCHLYTTEGQKLTDFVGTWGPAILGHNNPEIRAAVNGALEKGTSFGTPNPYEVTMAELICEAVPSIEKVRMVNSGTEATMSCIRLARGFTQREKIIKFEGCYHGHHDSLLVKAGSGALTFGNPDSAGVTEGTARDTVVLPYNDLDALKNAFEQNSEEIAAIILEPIPANMGLVMPEGNYLKNLVEIAHNFSALVIFDEVMSGFRVALGGVQEWAGITPDLTALGKIIGGGLPVGAFGGRAEIMDLLAPDGPVYQAGTLSGNPLALAAGITAVNTLQNESPYAKLDEMTQMIVDCLSEAFSAKGIAVQLPQIGSMFSIFFADSAVRNFEDVMASERHRFSPFFSEALKKGIFFPPSAFETCFVSTAHTQDVVEQTCDTLSRVIQSL